MKRPSGSYRAARRNEARQLRKSNPTGKRVPSFSYAELLRVNAMALANRRNTNGGSS